MLKVSKSIIHDFDTIFCFSGEKLSNAEGFLFKETESIFGRQNMASTLIEYQSKSELRQFLMSTQGQSLLADCNKKASGKVGIIEIEIHDFSGFKVEYQKKHDFTVLNSLLEFVFRDHIKMSVEINATLADADQFSNFVNFRLFFPRKLMEEGSEKLSSTYHHAIDKTFYVDSQVPVFYLGPIFSGYLKNEKKI